MDQVKNILGFVATFLVFVSYIPYLRDINQGKTKPHIYSWFLWVLVAFIAFTLQYSGGAGSGSFVTLAAAVMCVAVIISGLLQKSKITITKMDTVFLVLAFISLGLWLIAKQPILATILATTVDLLAFAPTVRKSWIDPFSETLSFYYLTSLRFALAVIALQHYSFVTALYPITWLMVDILFVVMLLWRRKQVAQK